MAMSVSRLLLFLLILHSDTLTLSKRFSGVYVDNGLNQTVRLESLTPNSAINLEKQMLDILELPKKRRHDKLSSFSSSSGKTSAHMFLMDAYKMFDEEEDANAIKDDFNIKGRNQQIISNSDTIISFAAQNHKAPKMKITDKVNRLWFDVSKVSRHDEIVYADLRLYCSMRKVQNKKYPGPIIIEVSRVLTGRTKTGKREFLLLDSVKIPKKEGWMTLNITESLHYWVHNSGVNRGLYLTIYAGSRDRTIKPEDIGIVGFKGDPEKRPFMVGYFKRTRLRKNKRIHMSSTQVNVFEEMRIKKKPMPCKRERLYVNFADLKWNSWIFAPHGFDAYFCSGECTYPFPQDLPTTNHAIVQALVNLRINASVPKASCVPTELGDIKVVYKLEDEIFILKRYKDMSVKSCGCQ